MLLGMASGGFSLSAQAAAAGADSTNFRWFVDIVVREPAA
jgi:hypothetical protein